MADNGAKMKLVRDINILAIDDEKDFLESVESLFGQDEGVTVKTCLSPEEAVSELQKDSYQIVIADINFKKTSNKSGAAFVVDNRKGLLDKSYVVVVTGNAASRMERYNELNSLGVPVLGKTDDWQDLVSDHIDETVARRLEEVETFLLDKPEIKLKEFDSKLDVGVKEVFLDWLSSFPNQEKKVFLMGGPALSAIELYENVEKGSELGERLLGMFVREIRYSFKLENGNGNGNGNFNKTT